MQDVGPFVRPLKEARRDDIAAVGGKAANLGELISAGFPVPDGFAVTTAAYDYCVAQNSLAETLSETSQDGEAARSAITGAPIPEEISQPVLAAYHSLGSGPVAVRSSASAEDLPGESFAGQHDSFFDVTGEAELLKAVTACWAGLWSDRALDYRNRRGIRHDTVRMGVVVQRMVQAEVAGVLFTVNPVTGARNELVINAYPGLGEAVVSGAVTPFHFVMRHRLWGWTVASRRASTAKQGPGPAPGGKASDRPPLKDKGLRKLAAIGSAIERHFGPPQDVEWAQAHGKMFITQTRPMTAVPEPPFRTGRWHRTALGTLAEFLPERPYPLEMSSWTPIPFETTRKILRPLGLRVPAFHDLFIQQDGVVVKFREESRIRLAADAALAPFRFVGLAYRYDSLRWRDDPHLAKAVQIPAELGKRDLRDLDLPGLLATIHESMSVLSPFLGELRRRYLPRAALATFGLHLELKLLGKYKLRFALNSGVLTKTLETNRRLEDLAAMVKEDGSLLTIFAKHGPGELRNELEDLPPARDFLRRFDAFLDSYGHRETQSLLLFHKPTWREAPDIVFGIIKELATAETKERDAATWEAARDEVLRHPVMRLPLLAGHFVKLLNQARCLVAIREDTRFYAALPLPVMRQAFLEIGQRLTAIRVLDDAFDIFHLTLKEIEKLGRQWPPPSGFAEKLRATAAQRLERRNSLAAVPFIDPRLYRAARREGAVVSGVPVSGGVAEGTVRLIRDPSEFAQLREGEVLVAPYTNPAWTPLFRRAAAAVVDVGGAGSHAAIVAREYGIPAVMGTIDGTKRLHDGQRVRVDGDQGDVFAL